MKKKLLLFSSLTLFLSLGGIAISYAFPSPPILNASSSSYEDKLRKLKESSDEDQLQGAYLFPYATGVQQPNNHGLKVGYIGKYQKVYDSDIVEIEGLPGKNYGIIETNITVDRLGYNNNTIQKVTGKSLHFSDRDSSSNNGYVLVDREEAMKWIDVLNGNPAYIFGGSVIKTYIVKSKNGKSYEAFNLAEIAEESGGRGTESTITPMFTVNPNVSKNISTSSEESDQEIKENLVDGQKVILGYFGKVVFPLLQEQDYLFTIDKKTKKKSTRLGKIKKVDIAENGESFTLKYEETKEALEDVKKVLTVTLEDGTETLVPVVLEYEK